MPMRNFRNAFPDLRTEGQKKADQLAEQTALRDGIKDKQRYDTYIANKDAELQQTAVAKSQ